MINLKTSSLYVQLKLINLVRLFEALFGLLLWQQPHPLLAFHTVDETMFESSDPSENVLISARYLNIQYMHKISKLCMALFFILYIILYTSFSKQFCNCAIISLDLFFVADDD